MLLDLHPASKPEDRVTAFCLSDMHAQRGDAAWKEVAVAEGWWVYTRSEVEAWSAGKCCLTLSQILFHQAPEHEGVIVEPAPKHWKRLEAARKNTDIVWR